MTALLTEVVSSSLLAAAAVSDIVVIATAAVAFVIAFKIVEVKGRDKEEEIALDQQDWAGN